MDPSGVTSFSPDEKGEFSFDLDFDINDVAAQLHLEQTCADAKLEPALLDVTCYLDTFKLCVLSLTILPVYSDSRRETRTTP